MNDTLVKISALSYSYPGSETPALRNINLEISPGELLGVIGPSGAGKSTLGYTLSGFIPHFFQGKLRGEHLFCGSNVADSSLAELAGRIGIVVQNPFNQISGARYTVREEIAFGLENLGTPRDEMIIRVNTVLEQFGLENQADRSPFELSGGQQQRLALASIFAMQPDLLVLDEPTSQLDPAGTQEVFKSLYQLTETSPTTVILITHKLEYLAKFASRILALFEGEIKMDGSPNQVLTDPCLENWGIGSTQYTQAAVLAKARDLIQAAQIPITLEQAVEAFS